MAPGEIVAAADNRKNGTGALVKLPFLMAHNENQAFGTAFASEALDRLRWSRSAKICDSTWTN